MKKTDSQRSHLQGATVEQTVSQPLKLIWFSAQWCGPCQHMAPIVEATADKYRNQIHTIKVDVNADPKLADDFQIRGIPTLVLIQDGAVIDRQVGATSQAELSQWLAQHLSDQHLLDRQSPAQHLPEQQSSTLPST